MIEIPTFDKDGKPKDPTKVDGKLFGGEVRLRLIKEYVLMYEANQRQGTHSTKTRGEVAGSGAKPFRQKGTGRARQGSTQSGILRGGGVIHGPRPRLYGWAMPKKKKKAALDSAILGKLQDGEVRIIEDLEFSEPKTKQASALLKAMGVEGKCVIGLAEHNEAAYKSFRNIPKTQVVEARNFNPHLLVDGGVIVIAKAAFDQMLEARKDNTLSRTLAAAGSEG